MEDYIKAVLNGEDYFGSVSFVDDTDRETALRVLEDLGTNTDMETVDDLNDTVIFDRNAFDKDACAAKIAVVCNGLITPDDVIDYIREEALMDDERVYAIADAENIEKCNMLVDLAKATNWGEDIPGTDLAKLFQAVKNEEEYAGETPLNDLLNDPDVCQCRYGVSPQEYAAKLIGECREAKQHDKALTNLKAVAANIEIAQQQQDNFSL